MSPLTQDVPNFDTKANDGKSKNKTATIRAIVRKAINSKKRGDKERLARDAGVHPTTLSKWIKDPRYNTSTQSKKVIPVSVSKPKPNKHIASEKLSIESVNDSILDKIHKLPTTYEGLLREHIKLLLNSQT